MDYWLIYSFFEQRCLIFAHNFIILGSKKESNEFVPIAEGKHAFVSYPFSKDVLM